MGNGSCRLPENLRAGPCCANGNLLIGNEIVLFTYARRLAATATPIAAAVIRAAEATARRAWR